MKSTVKCVGRCQENYGLMGQAGGMVVEGVLLGIAKKITVNKVIKFPSGGVQAH